jgi:hypothetical protein
MKLLSSLYSLTSVMSVYLMPMKLHEILIEIGLITSKLNVIGSTSEFIIYVQCKNKTCRTGLPLQPVGTCFFFSELYSTEEI